MLRTKLAFLFLMCFLIAACNKSKNESTQQQAPAAQPSSQSELPPAVQEPISPEIQQQPAPGLEREQTKSAEIARKVSSPGKKPTPVKESQVEAPVPPAKEIPTEVVAPAIEARPPVAVAPVEPPPTMPAAKPQPRYATIPSGIAVQVRLQDPLDSGVNLTGDTFRAILDHDLAVDGILVAPRGSMLDGKISHSERSGRVQGRATMALQLIALHIGQQTYPIQTQILNFEADSSQKKDAAKVGIGAGLGAVIGAIAGGGKGAAIGAAVGGGAGGATVLATRGNEVKLESEQRLSFSLQHEVKIELPPE